MDQHDNLVVITQYIMPRLSGKDPSENRINDAEKILKKSLSLIENHFLKDTKFINSSEVSIADLMAVCEFAQFKIVDVDVTSGRPRLKEWFSNCESQLQPHFGKVNKMIDIARKKGVFTSKL